MTTTTTGRVPGDGRDAGSPGPVAMPFVFEDAGSGAVTVTIEVDTDFRWWPEGDASPVEVPLPSNLLINGQRMEGHTYATDPNGVHARRVQSMAALRRHLHAVAESAFDALSDDMRTAGLY
jgi:hypothetical protein